MEIKTKISVVIPSAPARDFSRIINNLRQIKPDNIAMQIIIVKGTWPPLQRNMAIERADGEYVFLFDDDVIIPQGVIEKAVNAFQKKPRVDVIGGPNLTPPSNGFLQHCFGLAHASYFTGAFTAARYRPSKTLKNSPEKIRAEHLISCNLAFRSKVLKAHPFDLKIFPNEENELLNRMQKKGLGLKYDPDFFVYHHRRKTLASYSKQIFAWGKGRIMHTFNRPGHFNPAFFAPLLFLIYLTGLLFTQNTLYLMPLFLYVFLDVVFSIQAALRGANPSYFFSMLFIFPLTHIAYAFGLIRGFAAWHKTKPLPSKEDLTLIEIELN